MMQTLNFSVLGAIALAFATLGVLPVTSAEPVRITKSQKEIFEALDANDDGKVTEKEFVITGLYEIFLSFDFDKNKKVSREEFMKATKTHKIDHEAEWKAMSGGAAEITFEDSLRNKVAVEELKGYFRKDLDKAGRGYVTLRDLGQSS